MSLYKTEAGAEFAQLVRVSKLRPAEIARQMRLSKATLSNYMSGKIAPPPSRMDALRRIVTDLGIATAEKYPAAPGERIITQDPPIVRAAGDMLKEIHDADPKGFETVHQVIVHYYSKRPAPKPVSSELAGKIVKAAERAVVSKRKKASDRHRPT